MPVIKVAKPPKPESKESDVLEMLAALCYHYPQYKFSEARKLPFKRVKLLLRVARRIEASKMLALTNIVAAPHTKKGAGVKKMQQHFKKLIDQDS